MAGIQNALQQQANIQAQFQVQQAAFQQQLLAAGLGSSSASVAHEVTIRKTPHEKKIDTFRQFKSIQLSRLVFKYSAGCHCFC